MKFKVALVHLVDQEYSPSSHWPLLEDEIKMRIGLDLGTREIICAEGILRRVSGGETEDSGDQDPCPSRRSRSGAIAIASHSVPQLKKVLDVQFRLLQKRQSKYVIVPITPSPAVQSCDCQQENCSASSGCSISRRTQEICGFECSPVTLQFFQPGTAPRFARRHHLGSAGNGHTRQYKLRITAGQCEPENTHQRRRWRIPYGILQWV